MPASAGSVVKPKFVVAGGGTAGHIEPGLSVCAALIERGVAKEQILWVGSRRGMEANSVPAAGIPVLLLSGRGIQRKLSAQNLRSAAGLTKGFFTALLVLARRRPAAILGLGGYASVAALVSGIVLRIPILVAEQNARAGSANRLAGRFAKVCAVPSDVTDLPSKVVTGNPVRPAIVAVSDHRDRSAARDRLGIAHSATVIAVFAGSLGSRRINEALAGAVELCADRSDLFVYHVIGKRDFASFLRPTVPASGIRYRDVEYESDMATLLEAADLVISRSGGSTVAELSAIGIASVLVPLPIAPRDHQRFNAEMLSSVGAAVIVADADCTAQRLAELMKELSARPETLQTMGAAARSIGRPDAADRIADLLLTLAKHP